MTPDSTDESDEKWTATVRYHAEEFEETITVPGPKHIQALNQVWFRIPSLLGSEGIDSPDSFEEAQEEIHVELTEE